MKVGFYRTSEEEITNLAVSNFPRVDRLYLEKKSRFSRRVRHRQELNKFLDFLREGDTVILSNLYHLSEDPAELGGILLELDALRVNLIAKDQDIDTRGDKTGSERISKILRDYTFKKRQKSSPIVQMRVLFRILGNNYVIASVIFIVLSLMVASVIFTAQYLN